MISFKEYAKELVKSLPDFFTVGYALKEKRIDRAKEEIKKKLGYKSNRFDDENIKVVGNSLMLYSLAGLRFPKMYSLEDKYGINIWHFFDEVVNNMRPKSKE